MYMNDNIEDKNNPILVVHNSAGEGVLARFARKKGESSYVKHRLAGIIRRLGGTRRSSSNRTRSQRSRAWRTK
jgi:hypothetical protein